MANQSFKLHSPQNLTSYLKKFSSIEKTLLFEIHEDRIIAKTHTPEKSVVKIGSVLVTDIMDSVSGKENVKIALFSVDNLIASLKHFNDSDIKIEVNGEPVAGENVATSLKAKDKSLKIDFPCASMSMFRYIDEALAKKLVDTSSSIFSFRIDKETLTRISALSSLDNDNDILSISSSEGEVSFKGKSFELKLPGVSTDQDGEISFYKSHFNFIDKEDSEVFVLDNKVIFKSLESDTSIVIGKVE